MPWQTLPLGAPNITEECGDLHPAVWERPCSGSLGLTPCKVRLPVCFLPSSKAAGKEQGCAGCSRFTYLSAEHQRTDPSWKQMGQKHCRAEPCQNSWTRKLGNEDTKWLLLSLCSEESVIHRIDNLAFKGSHARCYKLSALKWQKRIVSHFWSLEAWDQVSAGSHSLWRLLGTPL